MTFTPSQSKNRIGMKASHLIKIPLLLGLLVPKSFEIISLIKEFTGSNSLEIQEVLEIGQSLISSLLVYLLLTVLTIVLYGFHTKGKKLLFKKVGVRSTPIKKGVYAILTPSLLILLSYICY